MYIYIYIYIYIYKFQVSLPQFYTVRKTLLFSLYIPLLQFQEKVIAQVLWLNKLMRLFCLIKNIMQSMEKRILWLFRTISMFSSLMEKQNCRK